MFDSLKLKGAILAILFCHAHYPSVLANSGSSAVNEIVSFSFSFSFSGAGFAESIVFSILPSCKKELSATDDKFSLSGTEACERIASFSGDGAGGVGAVFSMSSFSINHFQNPRSSSPNSRIHPLVLIAGA